MLIDGDDVGCTGKMSIRSSMLKGSLLVLSGTFIVGLLVGGLLWPHITIPYTNTDKISGPLMLVEFNPLNNLLRFLVFISLPAALLAASGLIFPGHIRFPQFRILKCPREKDPRFHRIVVGLAMAGSGTFALGILLQFFNGEFAPSPLDFFHEGETLTPAYNWFTGNGIWSGSFIVHGAFFDIFRTVLGWSAFNVVSIGAHRVAWSFMDHCTPVLMTGLIVSSYLLLDEVEDSGGALLFLVLMLGTYGLLLKSEILFHKMHKIVPYLAGMLLLLHAMTKGSKWLWFMSGVMSAAAFFYSIDIGAFLFALTLSAVLFATYCAKMDRLSRAESPPGYAFLYWVVSGWILGLLAATLAVGSEELGLMLDNTWYWFRYKDYVDSYVYPNPFGFSEPWWLHRMPLVLGAVYLFAAVFMHRYLMAPDRRYHACIWFLFVASGIIFARYALGRSDMQHIPKGSLFLLLSLPLLSWTIFQHLPVTNRIIRTQAFQVIGVILVLLIGFATLLPSVVNIRWMVNSSDRIGRLVHLHDSAYLEVGDVKIYDTLKKLTCTDEWLYVYTSDPALYYLLRRPPKTIFFVPWYASGESMQRKMIAILKKQPPQYILYGSPSPLIDGISNKSRFPLIERWIANGYVDYVKKDGWHLKVRRPSGGVESAKRKSSEP